MRSRALWFSLGVASILACAATPSIQEYVLDPSAGFLRGKEPKDDVPLAYCDEKICYAYKDEDVRKIKKYIVSLEERLKACQEEQQKK